VTNQGFIAVTKRPGKGGQCICPTRHYLEKVKAKTNVEGGEKEGATSEKRPKGVEALDDQLEPKPVCWTRRGRDVIFTSRSPGRGICCVKEEDRVEPRPQNVLKRREVVLKNLPTAIAQDQKDVADFKEGSRESEKIVGHWRSIAKHAGSDKEERCFES